MRAQCIRVGEAMESAVVVSRHAALEDVATGMIVGQAGCALVVDASGQLTGIITMSDFTPREVGRPRGHFRDKCRFSTWIAEGSASEWFKRHGRRPVEEMMSSPVVSVAEDDNVNVAANRMAEYGFCRLPVTRDGRPVGVVSQRRMMRLMLRKG